MAAPSWVDEAADLLQSAERDGHTVELLSSRFADLDLDSAYAVHLELSRRREAAGDPVVGVKLGLADPDAQRKFGLQGPVFGFLHASGRLVPGQRVPAGSHRHAEPELVIVAAHGDGERWQPVTVAAGIEIDSSRYHPGLFSIVDIVADSTWAGWYRIGDQQLPFVNYSAGNPTVELSDGRTTARRHVLRGHGSGSDSGVIDPGESLAAVAGWLRSHDRELRDGWFVFTGGLIDPVAVTPAGVRGEFGPLGQLEVASQDGGDE